MPIQSRRAEVPEGRAEPAPVLAELRRALEDRLERHVTTPSGTPPHLADALRHALIAPSKRIRPVLLHLVATGDSPDPVALDAGVAVEMVHTASLILDDLPSMDDAALRRSRPTTHVLFGEATAILAAIALMNRAFGILADLPLPPARRARLARILSDAIGWNGLVAGQEMDIRGLKSASATEAERLNWLKTGVLFVAAAEMGAVLRALPARRTASIRDFAAELGHAFQTADDLLDLSTAPEAIGKDVGKDAEKTNIVSILGAESARTRCREHLARADAALVKSGIEPGLIRALVSRYFSAVATGPR